MLPDHSFYSSIAVYLAENGLERIVSALDCGELHLIGLFKHFGPKIYFNYDVEYSALLQALRVCPETSGRIAKFSEHEAN